jgi:hypothetical protein
LFSISPGAQEELFKYLIGIPYFIIHGTYGEHLVHTIKSFLEIAHNEGEFSMELVRHQRDRCRQPALGFEA